jgi:protoporphyrinogen/coproporphyrinogen III oxidase
VTDRPHVAVLGGGIAGLAAAHALVGSGNARVTVLEADRRFGGKVRSERIAAETVDVGAESLLARVPAAIELCGELGLEGELVEPANTATAVWVRGSLRELPGNPLGGLPEGVMPLLRSGVLSSLGVARASLDLVLPATPLDSDRSVGELVGGRLGRQALDRLVEPLLRSIYAADGDRLSVRATAPQLERLAREHRSLIRGLRGVEPAPSRGPLFLGLPGGLERIVARLCERLEDAELRCGAEATRLESADEGRYRLSGLGFEPLLVDGVVVATPADSAAQILNAASPVAAEMLRGIPYSSTVVVTLRYPPGALPQPPAGAGFLVPRSEGRLLGACTLLSAKWPHLATAGGTWLRSSIVGTEAVQAQSLDDATLVARVSAELSEAIGLRGGPANSHVTRWERALPRYEPGHLDLVTRIERELHALPGVALAGAAYRGMGVSQCVAQGRAAAAQTLAALEGSVRAPA